MVAELIKEREGDAEAVAFLNQVLEFVKEEPDSPTHGTSKFIVTCFSGDEDELTQWDRYSKPNGYAIGYIIVHEMVHLLEPTHGSRFVGLMDRFLPMWQHRRQILNQLPVRNESWRY